MKLGYWKKRKYDENACWEQTTLEEMRAACAPYWQDPHGTILQTRLIWSVHEFFALCAQDPNEHPLRHKHGGMVGVQV